MASVLRDGVIRVYNSAASQQNKGDKMHLLYDYLISNEFAEQWSAIREGFQSMKMSIQRERDAMERLWKAREKQLEKVLLNAAHIRGSIEGIAGSNSIDLHLLEDVDLNEFSDEIEGWVIEELNRIGLDTAKSVLALSKEELVRRTDLEEETIEGVLGILKKEFE